MPTMEHSEEEVDDMYEKTEELLDAETKGKDYTVVMRDLNAVVAKGKDDAYVRHCGLGYGNIHGQMLVDFCKKKTDVYRSLTPGSCRTEDVVCVSRLRPRVSTHGRSLETQ